MIVKSAMLVKSPFDSNYINVPDKIINEGSLKESLLNYFIEYCDILELNSRMNFPDGYSVPLNNEITLTFKNNRDDNDIYSYNYIMLFDVAIEQITEQTNYEAYFINNIKINNSVTDKSVTINCVRDLWVKYYNQIINSQPQKIARSHEFPFIKNNKIDAEFYTEDDINMFSYTESVNETVEHIILYLKILLDPNGKYKIGDSDAIMYEGQTFEKGQFLEVAIPYALYNKFGDVITYDSFGYDEIEYTIDDDLNSLERFGKNAQNHFNLGYPQIVGAYLTFAPLANYEVKYRTVETPYPHQVRYVNFTDTYVEKGSLKIKVGEEYSNTSLLCIGRYSHPSREYEYEPFIDRFLYWYEGEEFLNNIDFNEKTFHQFVPEYYVTSKMPILKVGGKKLKIYGKGKPYFSLKEKDNQNGNIIETEISFGNRKIIQGKFNKIVAGQAGYIPTVVDQYVQYMTANMNRYNTQIFNDVIGSFNNTVNLGVNAGAAIASQGASLALNPSMGIGGVLSSYANLIYDANGRIKDLKNATSSLSTNSASGISDFVFLDRPLVYYDSIFDSEDYTQYLYNCHIYGTLRSKIGNIKDNCRNNYDYIIVDGFNTTNIKNFNDFEAIKNFLSRGVRKVHLDSLESDNINLFIKNLGRFKEVIE